MTLLRQNSELRPDRVWNWTLPAWVVRLSNGRALNVCPSAGVCKDLCYARNGTFNFPQVKAAHLRNLEATLDDLDGWKAAMISELRHKRFRPTGQPRLTECRDALVNDSWTVSWLDTGGAAVRIHDSGDFYTVAYFKAWVDIAEQVPDVLFYAYTKEVALVKRFEAILPPNFRIVYSMGGTQDHLLDLERDRHAEVFPDLDSLTQAGYTDQEDSDLLAVLLDTPRIGIPANNIPAFKRKMGTATFGELELAKNRTHRLSEAA